MILLHPSGRRLSVPKHAELGRGLLRALIRDAELSRDEFIRLLSLPIIAEEQCFIEKRASGTEWTIL
jgi:hypothetical protein